MRELHDNSGAIIASVRYDSFGRPLDALPIRFGYTGRDWDAELGLQYNRARYYDPGIGRWIGQDPIGFAAGDGNLYEYAGNEPTDFIDPSGEKVQGTFRTDYWE